MTHINKDFAFTFTNRQLMLITNKPDGCWLDTLPEKK